MAPGDEMAMSHESEVLINLPLVGIRLYALHLGDANGAAELTGLKQDAHHGHGTEAVTIFTFGYFAWNPRASAGTALRSPYTTTWPSFSAAAT